MSTLPAILTGKELNYQPALLASFQFSDGSFLYASTHNLSAAEGGNTYQGNSYLARIDDQDIAQVQARSEQGIDRFSDVTINLLNADQFLLLNYEFNIDRGFKGAILQLALVLMDIDPAGAYFFNSDSPTPFKFTGICDAPGKAPAGAQTLSIRATTSHNMAMVQLPVELIQQRCINSFPINAARRLAGATDMSSVEWGCGYNPDQAGTDPEIGGDCRRGNTGTANQTDSYGNVIADSAGIFTICDYTKATCVMLGMYKSDSSSRTTARFKAIQWMPPWEEGQSNSYVQGKDITVFAMRNNNIYTGAYPLLYGTQWINNPVIANVIGDGNSTRMEIVVCNGDIGVNGIQMVVVNGVIIPAWGGAVQPQYGAGDPLERWNFLDNQENPGLSKHTGSRNGYATLDAEYNGNGDPYGGLATIEVVIYADLASGTGGSVPSVQILANGPRIVKYQPIVSIVNGLVTFPAGFVNLDLAGNPPFTVSVVGNSLAGNNASWALSSWTTGPPYTITLAGAPSGTGTGGCIRYLVYGHVEGLTSPAGNTYSSFGQNPAWVVFDMLIWANYSFTELDILSWVAAAQFCDVDVNYTDLNGNAASHPRFIFQAAYVQQQKANSVLQAALRSFNGQLVPNSDTGLLQLFIRQTLADSQPSPIPGSNYNTAIASPTALNTASQGYAAYLIDESILLRDDKGNPMMNGPYALPNAQTPNNLVIGFQDADNQWVQDSISMTDPDDVARSSGYELGGAAIPAGYSVTGISSFDQGGRIANVILAENFRGNPFSPDKQGRGTRGTYFWQPTATHRVEHLRVGHIVLLRFQSQQLQPSVQLQSPPGTGISGILCRVEAIKPASNYERMGLTLKWHEDDWYTDLYGQTGTPGYSSPLKALPSRPPLPWKPYGQQPIAGDSMYQPSEWNFQAAVSYIPAADGSPLAQLTIGGCFPVNQFSSAIQPPNMNVQALTASTGGTVPGGLRLVMAISAQDAAGYWTPLSKFTSVSISSATNTNTATTPTINWDPNTVNWALFGGVGHHSLCEQARGSGTPSSITVSALNAATYGPPDPLAASVMIETKEVEHGGVWGDTCTAVASLGSGQGTISFATACTTGQFNQVSSTIGYDLTLLANPTGDSTNILIADFHVVSNTGGVYTVMPDSVAVGLSTSGGYVFEMRAFPTIITATTIGDPNFVSAYAVNGFGTVGNENEGFRLRIVKGTGRGQERNIIASNSDSVTIGRLWDTTPDNTSRFIIEAGAWQDQPYATQSAADLAPSPAPTVAVVNIENYRLQTILVRAIICDANGKASSKRYSPIRELYVEGAQGTRIVEASTTMLQTDGIVSFFDIIADATFTCLPFVSVPNQLFTINRQDCGSFTVALQVASGSGDTFPGGGTTIVLTDDVVNFQSTFRVPAA